MDIVYRINQQRKKDFLDRIKTELKNEELFRMLIINHNKKLYKHFETLDNPTLFVNEKGELVK